MALRDWLPEVVKVEGVAASVAKVIEKAAEDLEAVHSNPLSVMNLVNDLRQGIPEIIAAVHASPEKEVPAESSTASSGDNGSSSGSDTVAGAAAADNGGGSEDDGSQKTEA